MTGNDIREYVELTCAMCGVPDLAGKISIRWNTRFTARMGDAQWYPAKEHGVVRLSVPLWPKASSEERVETIIHETCHVIAAYKFGPGPAHGPAWQMLMHQCGYPSATRCHMVDRDGIAQRRQRQLRFYKVACGCPEGVAMGRVQFRRLRAGAKYCCRKCGDEVKLPM